MIAPDNKDKYSLQPILGHLRFLAFKVREEESLGINCCTETSLAANIKLRTVTSRYDWDSLSLPVKPRTELYLRADDIYCLGKAAALLRARIHTAYPQILAHLPEVMPQH